MKTFGELIAWELEQERKLQRKAVASEEAGSKGLSAMVLRKLKYLSDNSTTQNLQANGGAA